MKSSDFEYELPKELIAYYPERKRDESRLMVLNRADSSIGHTRFYNLPFFLREGDLLVFNNTKVIPARLYCTTENNTQKEILLERRISSRIWKLIVKKPADGMVLYFNNGLNGTVSKTDEREWIIEFNKDADRFIEDYGCMPLPPYIERMAEEEDRERYQTIYARKEGAIAAPTAGLHFTEELMKRISDMGIGFTSVTLHVGIGTFRPVKTGTLKEHKMHRELVEIPESSAHDINLAKKESGRIVAVGTTVVRSVESSVNENDELVPGIFGTDLFIYPPYEFRIVDAMITNFHMPRSTLLMLVSAFGGRDFILDAYNEAVRKKYRFLSYGDAMIII